VLTIPQIIGLITPVLISNQRDNLGPRVFFLWGSLCTACFFYAYLLVPETKGLTLEQVDRMFEESTPMKSSKWVPHSTFAADMGFVKKEEGGSPEHVEEVKAQEPV
jgi:SP family sugar:H+ symporter-like MFS transporter